MSARIIFTVGGMAINARHRRDVEPAYRTGWDEPSLADCNGESQRSWRKCPECSDDYTLHAKHRAEVAS